MENILEGLTAILIVLKEILRVALAGLADLLRAALKAQAICLGRLGWLNNRTEHLSSKTAPGR